MLDGNGRDVFTAFSDKQLFDPTSDWKTATFIKAPNVSTVHEAFILNVNILQKK